MASPVFDREQYELRGHTPTPMTEGQKTALDLVLSRVNGQLDWNAQLLGFSGTSYWGKRIPTTDGSYKWKGLPETVAEKRAVQTGAFGVYNKDKDYADRPAPFNRSEVRASADLTFDIFEEDGRTRVVPYGVPRGILYEENPRLIVGGQYTFNALVDVEANTGATEWLYVVQDLEQGITSVRLLGEGAESEAVFVRIKDSQAEPFLFFLATWEDISDWTSQRVLDQFIGVWGNKGAAIASHFLFDALDVHGFDEGVGLSLDEILATVTIPQLLDLVGLVPGPASGLVTSHYNFVVEGCDDVYQPEAQLVESTDPIECSDAGKSAPCYIPPDPDFGECDTPNYTLTLKQLFSDGVTGIATDPGPETSNAIGCNGVQYLYPPTCFIDNGEYESVLGQFFLDGGDYDFPVIATRSVGDGLYDRDPFSVCDGLPEDYERIIEGDDLIIDVAGGPGPVLMSDPGADNEIELVASGGDYDGFVIGFDGVELAAVSFNYDAKTTYGETRFPCVEWVFDPALDNSTYSPIASESAWMGTDDGEYDRERSPAPFASQSDLPCIGGLEFVGGFLSFDDGAFDEIVEPNCDLISTTPLNCELVDSGFYQPSINPLPPPESNTECGAECGTVDGSIYPPGSTEPVLSIIDGGQYDTCIIYDNTEYDLGPAPAPADCVNYNNGSYSNPLPPLDCVLQDSPAFPPGPYSEPPADDGTYIVAPVTIVIGLSTEDGFVLLAEDGDELGLDPALTIPVEPLNCAPCSSNPDPFISDCVLNNGLFEAAQPPTSTADDSFYDEDPNPFCVPCQDPAAPVIPCPVEMMRVRLDQIIFSAPRWRMRPSVMNSETPLRLWKNRVLMAPDAEADGAYINPLVADENSGPENPFAYRHFARLPAEYPRNGKFWNRAEAVLANESYFSRALPPTPTQLPIVDELPLLYDEVYQLGPSQLPDDATFYAEDYLVSTVRVEDESVEDGFVGAIEVYEEPSSTPPFVSATIVGYDAYAARLLNADGTRAGSYLVWNRRDRNLTGFLQDDIDDFALRYTTTSEPVVSDASRPLIPNVEFPDDPDTASFSNYAVCYAYFVADMSAGDDPVFDPANWISHRSKTICEPRTEKTAIATEDREDILTQNFEFIAADVPLEQVEIQHKTMSRYIFHDETVPPCATASIV